MNVIVPQGLAEKFRGPANGRYETFLSSKGQQLSVLRHEIEDAKADLIVQTGLNEPKEKYGELHSDLVSRGYNVHAMDWPWQGFSDGSPNHRRRHTNGIKNDVKDFVRFVDHIDATRKSKNVPLYMMGHSYGGQILSRYVADKKHRADGVFLTAPMIDFYFVPELPFRALSAWGVGAYKLAKTLAFFQGNDAYAPTSQDWSPKDRDEGEDIFSNDPERKKISNLWIGANPKTQVGRPTLGWVADSVRSCRALQKTDFSHLKIPFTIAVAGEDVITPSGAIYDLVSRMPNGHTIDFPEAKHEVWQCSDNIRNDMLDYIDQDIAKLRAARGLTNS